MTSHETYWSTEIRCIAAVNDDLVPVNYKLTFHLDVITDNAYEQVIGYERLKFLIKTLVNGSTFVDSYSDLCEIIHAYSNATIIDCWTDPWDQFIGVILYYKANAILEGKMGVHSLSIQGTSDDNLEFIFTDDEMIGADWFDEKFKDWAKNKKINIPELTQPWYYRSDTSLNDFVLHDEDEDEYYIWKNGITWKDVGLEWEEPANENDDETPKDNIIHMPFRPKIVK